MNWLWIDVHYTVAGFLVGVLVGVTGVGGGSLMTPILVLLFGISPATAVGTDLLFAAATKSLGSIVNAVNHTIDWRIVRRLASGSLPATVLALLVLSVLHMSTGGAREVITVLLSIALLVTAVALLTRGKVSARYGSRLANLDDSSIRAMTVATGAVVGALVTFSSVGAGAIGVTVLVLLYPRVPIARIVGSDIAHAVPLTLIAGLGHGAMGSLDVHVLVSLLAGSFPGIFVGSVVSVRAPDKALRYAVATILIVVGVRLALGVHADAGRTVASAESLRGSLHAPAATAALRNQR